MGKITKEQSKLHDQANDLIHSDKPLSFEEKEFVLENWTPLAENNVGKGAIFFTPMALARDLVEMGWPNTGETRRVVDLCAGTGRITWHMVNHAGWDRTIKEIVAVEITKEFRDIGKRLMPEVTWVGGNVLDRKLWEELGRFDAAFSNPPFGKPSTRTGQTGWLRCGKVPIHLMVAEIALRVADMGGIFLLPQVDCPFRHINGRYEETLSPSTNYKKFVERIPAVDFGYCSIDATSPAWGNWDGAKPTVEMVNIEIHPDSNGRMNLNKEEDYFG